MRVWVQAARSTVRAEPGVQAVEIGPAAFGGRCQTAGAGPDVLSDNAFSQPAARLQNSGSNR